MISTIGVAFNIAIYNLEKLKNCLDNGEHYISPL